MNLFSESIEHPYPRLRRFAIDVAITAVFNLVIALIITYVLRVNSSFVTNLLVSMCIGILAVTFVDGGRLLLWGLGKPPKIPFILLVMAALPAAQQLGHVIASRLSGIPVNNFIKAHHQNPTGYIVVTLLISLFITWFFWNRSTLAHLTAEAEAEKARAAAVEKQAVQAQLQLLQAQIEPHMLFNTLANLQGLIAVDPPRAQQMLDQLILYLRATLSSSRAEQTTLGQEFALMEAYLGLMKVRLGGRLSYALHLPDALRDRTLPPMLLQPLVENAIKHGIEPKIEGGHIDVQAIMENAALILTVRDTGLGLRGAGTTSGTRVGMANLHERLQALYDGNASFSLTPNHPEGAIAQFTLPL
jgi:hypothetical protein